MSFLQGWKTKIAAFGLLGLAVYQLSQGEIDKAMQSALAALAAFGLADKVDRVLAGEAQGLYKTPT